MSGGIPIPEFDPVQRQQGPNVSVPTNAPAAAFGLGEAPFQAAEKLGSETENLAQQYQMRANRTAFIQSQTRVGDLQDAIQAKVKQMKGQDALGAPDAAAKMWKDGIDVTGQDGSVTHTPGIDEITKDSPNAAVNYMTQKYAARQQIFLNRALQNHVAEEGQKFEVETAQGGIQNQARLAAMNEDDPDQLTAATGAAKQLAGHLADLQGLHTGDARDALVANQMTALHQGVVDARLDKGDLQGAQQYFDDNRGEMTLPSQNLLGSKLALRQDYQQGIDFYNQVKGFKLADGSPDLEKAKDYIYANSGKDAKGTDIAWTIARGQLNSDRVDDMEKQHAQSSAFQSQVVKMKNAGASLEDVINQVPSFAKPGADGKPDPYDVQLKQQWAQDQFAPAKTETDPVAYMDFWKAIHSDKVPDAQIGVRLNQAYTNGTMTSGDWKSLSEALYTRQSKGVDASDKLTWQQTDEYVKQNIGNKKDAAEVMTQLRQAQTDEKLSASQVYERAQQLLKPTVTKKGFLWNSTSPGYKVNQQFLDQQTIQQGKLTEYLGNDVLGAIRNDMVSAGAKKFTASDLDTFVKQYNGVESFKPGAPVNNAISSLRAHGQPILPANIDAVLLKYKDGRY